MEKNLTFSTRHLPKNMLNVDSFYGWFNFLSTVLAIVALIAVGAYTTHPVALVLLALAIGTLQYRLSMVLHECIHLTLLPSKRLNLLTGSVSAAMIFTTFGNFQDNHMAHHRFYRTEDDPSLEDYDIKPKTRWQLTWFIIEPLFGGAVILKLVQFLRTEKRESTEEENAGRKAKPKQIWQGLLALVVAQGLLFLLATRFFQSIPHYFVLVMLPAVTVMLFFSRLRTLLEHGDVEHEDTPPLNCGRNTVSQMIERMILSPLNFNYHYWHHKYPSVPSCNLPELHDWHLKEDGIQIPQEDMEAAETESFVSTLRHFYQIVGQREAQSKQSSQGS